MCGICGVFHLNAGAFSYDGRVAYREALSSATASMSLRGPDDEGFFFDDEVMLGFRRLSVIDIKGGAQPMSERSSSCVVVFNGEIYNYRELKYLLQTKGQVFETKSDTEVLLKSYLQWGRDCLEYLRGIFAFAIFDPREKILFLARDRLGVKPIFYSFGHSGFYFASTLSAIRHFPQVGKKIDRVSMSHYLTFIRPFMGRKTLFDGVYTLLPGECLTVQKGQSQSLPRQYWDFPVIAPKDKESPEPREAASRVRALVEDGLREQLISDVPLGGFLSGGIDSTIIASLAKRFSLNNYSAYSVGYDESKAFNEWPFVRMASEHCGIDCEEVHLRRDGYIDNWAFLIESKGLPLFTPNEVAIYELAKALRKDYVVALSGEGADEIFAGYTKQYFSSYDYLRSRKQPPPVGTVPSAVDECLTRLYGRSYFSCRQDHFFFLNSWLTLPLKQSLLRDELWRELDEDEQIFQYYADLFKRFAHCSTMDAYLHIHARTNLQNLLFRVDSSTMAASVEGRVPFTDHRLVDYAFSLPDLYKISWKSEGAENEGRFLNIMEIEDRQLIESKLILKQAFVDLVPRDILERPKMSFPVPFMEWFAGDMHGYLRELLLDSPLSEEFFKRRRLEEILDAVKLDKKISISLWPLANLCLWQNSASVSL